MSPLAYKEFCDLVDSGAIFNAGPRCIPPASIDANLGQTLLVDLPVAKNGTICLEGRYFLLHHPFDAGIHNNETVKGV